MYAGLSKNRKRVRRPRCDRAEQRVHRQRQNADCVLEQGEGRFETATRVSSGDAAPARVGSRTGSRNEKVVVSANLLDRRPKAISSRAQWPRFGEKSMCASSSMVGPESDACPDRTVFAVESRVYALKKLGAGRDSRPLPIRNHRLYRHKGQAQQVIED